jgi:hypothetical protein
VHITLHLASTGFLARPGHGLPSSGQIVGVDLVPRGPRFPARKTFEELDFTFQRSVFSAPARRVRIPRHDGRADLTADVELAYGRAVGVAVESKIDSKGRASSSQAGKNLPRSPLASAS